MDKDNDASEDIYLNITQIITKYGYPVEQYTVVTSDEYVLKLFRIQGNGPVLFLMHGLLGSADDWISPGPGFGLGFLLADKGYDVWMGNARGNKYSNRNTGMETSENKFWDFSWHEIGVFDIPAMIDHVLYITNNKKLIYIGYSQGNTAFLVMCSMRPEYNEKISLMISLSAVAWMSNSKNNIFNLLAPFSNQLYKYSDTLGIHTLFPDNTILKLLQRAFCGDTVSAFIVCQHILFLLGGVNYSQINIKRFPVICNHFPSGSSVKQIVHYGQLIVSGHFRHFDYGSLNLLKYGFPEPPIYPVEKITAPVAIFFSKGDWLANKKDVQKLQSKLSNQILFYTIPNKHFNHFDYLYAKETKSLVLPQIVLLIQQYSVFN
ncbi:unnamed protein product [Colias eurytheme]|nr:unnamed protein product [Colias eurytheme]